VTVKAKGSYPNSFKAANSIADVPVIIAKIFGSLPLLLIEKPPKP